MAPRPPGMHAEGGPTRERIVPVATASGPAGTGRVEIAEQGIPCTGLTVKRLHPLVPLGVLSTDRTFTGYWTASHKFRFAAR